MSQPGRHQEWITGLQTRLKLYEQEACIANQLAAESANIIGQLVRVEERRAELGAVGRNDLRQAASRRASALALVAARFPVQRLVSAHRQPLFSSMGLVKTGDHYDELHQELLEGRRRCDSD